MMSFVQGVGRTLVIGLVLLVVGLAVLGFKLHKTIPNKVIVVGHIEERLSGFDQNKLSSIDCFIFEIYTYDQGGNEKKFIAIYNDVRMIK